VHALRIDADAENGRLLCLLFVRIGALPAAASGITQVNSVRPEESEVQTASTPQSPSLAGGVLTSEHDRKWIHHVRPAGWVHPAPKPKYDLVVIGAGPGGLVCAAGAAALGARVALVERHFLGGDCLNVGCVPSKGVIRAARAWKDAATAAAEFGGPTVSGPGNFDEAMERMRRLRAGLSEHDSASRFRDLGVDVFFGSGRFVSTDTVAVDDVRLRFRRAVIATGARASAPPIPGLAEAGFHTNETIFDLTALPERLVVIGAGPIGCELGQSFARFGSQVTILDHGPALLPKDEPEAAAVVRRAMERDGVTFRLGAKIIGVSIRGPQKQVRFAIDGNEALVSGDEILVAAGRAPNIEGLGLDVAGIVADRHGVAVNDRLRTTNPRVYAVGDVASKLKFTHAADAQARLVLGNALFFGRSKASRLIIPWATYTSPELAHVGLTVQEAQRARIPFDSIRVAMSETDRGTLDGDTDGFLRVLVKKGTDRILGATLVAEHAGDMIGEIALAMTAGLGLASIGRTVHPYPTQGEIIRKAADAWRRTKLTPMAKKILGGFLRLAR
jgi:pyruvate/2-oxoglutarate dehydrogenase complex dihydrolipoamide dehydrogenase (E3) component